MSKVSFVDGLKSLVSSLINNRIASNTERFTLEYLDDEERTAMLLSGLGNKICSLKSNAALRQTLQFESEADRDYYDKRLAKHVRRAAKWAIGYGRGIIVLQHRGDDLATPWTGTKDADRVLLKVFDGKITNVEQVNIDLQSPDYYNPRNYQVRGARIHHSRVVAFNYVAPPETEAPIYKYGGVSIFDLIHEQLVADGIVQRASPRVIDKASSLFYKIRGFKEAMASNNHHDMVEYFRTMEKTRGIMSAGLVDAEDEPIVVNQSISNLSDGDNITLRRIAMVTSIPITVLVGENARGMNASGDNERSIFQDAIEAEQDEYWLDPINGLMTKLGKGPAWFKENQGETPTDRIAYETSAIDNALKLSEMGEDGRKYLVDKDVVNADDYSDLFSLDRPEQDEIDPELKQFMAELAGGGDNGQT